MLVVAVIGVLAAIALPMYAKYQERARSASAAQDLAALGAALSRIRVDNGSLPLALADIGEGGRHDPWGNAYQYVPHDSAPQSHWRKDKNIHPINTDFGLWSMGPNGQTSPQLVAAKSRDEIIRANDGRVVGLASDFDP